MTAMRRKRALQSLGFCQLGGGPTLHERQKKPLFAAFSAVRYHPSSDEWEEVDFHTRHF